MSYSVNGSKTSVTTVVKRHYYLIKFSDGVRNPMALFIFYYLFEAFFGIKQNNSDKVA